MCTTVCVLNYVPAGSLYCRSPGYPHRRQRLPIGSGIEHNLIHGGATKQKKNQRHEVRVRSRTAGRHDGYKKKKTHKEGWRKTQEQQEDREGTQGAKGTEGVARALTISRARLMRETGAVGEETCGLTEIL